MKVTWGYLVAYLAALGLTVAVFYAVPSGSSEAVTAASSTAALRAFGLDADCWVQEGVTRMVLRGERTVDVTVIRECTALNVLGIITGLLVPLKAAPVRKLAAAIVSAASLFALNVPRMALTLYLAAFDVYPFTLLPGRSLETFHYPISFAFGVAGVALLVLALSRWVIPELADTLMGIVDLPLEWLKHADESRKKIVGS